MYKSLILYSILGFKKYLIEVTITLAGQIFKKKKNLKSSKSLEIGPRSEKKFFRNNPCRKADYFDFIKKYIQVLGKIC